MQIYWVKIKKIIDETSEIKTFLLDCPQDFTWEEGAHTHLALAGFNAGEQPNRNLVRHMSISTLPYEHAIGITTRIRKKCSSFKMMLRNLEIGNEVALFKTHSNIPLKREGKNIYLLSAGVGLATFRPLVLDYFERPDKVNQMYALNIDSSKQFLFTDIFTTSSDKQFTSQFVDNRKDYYEQVKNLAKDKDGIYYIVGSDEFLIQNIKVLLRQGIQPEKMMLDKHTQQRDQFFENILNPHIKI